VSRCLWSPGGEAELRVVTVAYMDQADHDDEAQGHQLRHREDVLDPGGHADAGAVHPGEQH